MSHSVLVLNTGSTSTKLAVYVDRQNVLQKEYTHSREELQNYRCMAEQLPMRQRIAEEFVETEAISFAPFSAIVARGGILCPIHSGGYVINDAMLDYLHNVCSEEHASNLAAIIAHALAQKHNVEKAYIYDGITTDEMEPVARISGIPDMPRVAVSHALNMRATAHRAAVDLGKQYAQSSILVVHLGGGISLSMHHNGRVVDVVADDEGPFSPERAGGQQAIRLLKYMETKPTMLEKLRIMRGESGLTGYFGTSDARVVEHRIEEGDKQARLVYEAMAYQIAKSIGTLAVVTCGSVDCIALTGGLARSEMLTGEVARRTSFIAPVRIYAGENEMESLALGAFRILSGEETAQEFVY